MVCQDLLKHIGENCIFIQILVQKLCVQEATELKVPTTNSMEYKLNKLLRHIFLYIVYVY